MNPVIGRASSTQQTCMVGEYVIRRHWKRRPLGIWIDRRRLAELAPSKVHQKQVWRPVCARGLFSEPSPCSAFVGIHNPAYTFRRTPVRYPISGVCNCTFRWGNAGAAQTQRSFFKEQNEPHTRT